MSEFYTERVIRNVLNSIFTFSDVAPRFKNVDESTGNIFCPFHENRHSPAARMYWDDDRDIWVLHCFGECHATFTTYDYVNRILCDKYQKYKNPLDFLKKNVNSQELYSKLNYAKQNNEVAQTSYGDRIKAHINNVSEEYETTEDYIEALYTA